MLATGGGTVLRLASCRGGAESCFFASIPACNNMVKICTMAMIDILAVVAIMAVVELKGVKHAFIFLIQEPRQECGRSGG